MKDSLSTAKLFLTVLTTVDATGAETTSAIPPSERCWGCTWGWGTSGVCDQAHSNDTSLPYSQWLLAILIPERQGWTSVQAVGPHHLRIMYTQSNLDIQYIVYWYRCTVYISTSDKNCLLLMVNLCSKEPASSITTLFGRTTATTLLRNKIHQNTTSVYTMDNTH